MLGGGIEALVLVSLAVTAVVQLPALWLLRRIAPDLRFGWRGATRRTARKLTAFSWYIFVSQSATRVQYRTDELIIGAYLPVASVTPYALARRLAEVAQALTDQFMRVLTPLAAELNAVDDTTRLRVVFLHGTRLSLAIHIPVALATALMAGPLLGAWLGAEYVRYAPLVWLLSAAFLIDTGLWPAGAMLQAISRHQRLAAFAIFGAASNVALSIVLVRRWGLEGVAAATLITTLVTSYGLIAPYALSTLGVRAGAVLRSVLWPVLIPVLPSALAMLAVRHLVGTGSLPVVLATMALGAATYWAVFYLEGATMAERTWVRASVRSAVARVRAPFR
jgi:O-antigen/teichoic acid export membrane protein